MLRYFQVFSLAIVFLLVDFHAIFNSNWDSLNERQIIYNRLDQLYQQRNFYAYYDSVQNYLLKVSRNVPPDLLFKFAYSAYQNKNFSKARQLFNDLLQQQFLPDYSSYFYIRSLWPVDSVQAESLAVVYVRQHAPHPLTDSLLVPLAESLFGRKKFKMAHQYFQLAVERRVNKQKRVLYKRRAADCLLKQGLTHAALNEYYQIIKKFPSNPYTVKLVDWLEENFSDWYNTNFLNIYPVLSSHRRLEEARVKLEKFIRSTKDPVLREKARFFLLKNYYQQGRASLALYGFKDMLKSLKNKSLEPQIRLYIARSFLRLGYTQKAIKSYLDYAERYPRRRMAKEVVWKVALIYEKKGQIEKALKVYQKLYKTWRRSNLGQEARFRIGYSLFRLGKYKEAERVFNKIRFSRVRDFHKNRAQYWVAICREMINDTLNAHRLRRDLARNMWDDYYTLKSYLLEKEYLDSTLQIIKELRRLNNPLHYYGRGFQKHIADFEKVFLIYDLLGKDYALAELSTIKIDRSDMQQWVALAETYKRLKDYGRAYRIYDTINQRFYRNVSYGEKLFILKERFPYYYDYLVDKYCRRYGLESELVFALIKQESAFNHKAHSYANAYGLMQLIPPTARDMARLAGIRLRSLNDLYDPDLNIHLGTLYLKQLNRRFKGDKSKILAAYNAGPHRVKKWQKMAFSERTDCFIENMEFEQTRTYVRHVLKNYWAYKLLKNNFQIDHQKLLSMSEKVAYFSTP